MPLPSPLDQQTTERRSMAVELHHADCTDVMPSLPAGSVDMVLCDLPYGTTNCRWDVELDLEWLWGEYRRICEGPIILFAQSPFDKRLGMSNIKGLRYEWIWEKTNATGHLNAKRAPMKAHENILVFCDTAPPYYPIKTTGNIRKVATKRKRNEESPIYGETSGGVLYDSTDRYPRSVLTFPSDKLQESFHPTQKPVALCEYLILTYTTEGQVVMDNCMGSGTSGVAAANLGRGFVGIERDSGFFEVARGRIESANAQTRLFA
jgi:DNA modification methylase